MKLQQLLALCLLACIACTAIARPTTDEVPVYDGYEKEGYENDEGSYKYDGDYYTDKPECGPEQFPELKDALCVNTKTGEPVIVGHDGEEGECTIDKEDWCKPVKDTKWGCKYDYKRMGKVCRTASGACDVDDTCSGTSADCPNMYKEKGTPCRDAEDACDVADTCPGDDSTCPNKVKDKGTVCLESTSPCVKDAKCDGVEKSCPAPKDVAKGTPCKHDGIYSEAYGEDGKVALQSTVNAEIAKKHGWGTCHRCYEGECTAFKYEWYKSKPSKKHGKHGDKHSHDGGKYEKKSDKHEKEEDYEKKSDKYEDDDEWYESSYDTEVYAQLEGYESEVYCKKPDSKY